MNVKKTITFSSIILVVSLILSITHGFITPISAQKKQVTLTAIVAEPKERWDILFNSAQQKLREKHPDIDIKVDYRVLPYDATRTQILTAMAGRTPIDLVSVDQTWLGEFAQGGFLSDLTDRAKTWGREKDWYQTNWDGGKYNGKLYGVWAWTDIRAMWYWKDLLDKAGINPDSLKTWNGYIADAKQLNNALRGQGIQGMHLVGASHSPDMWYPYLWMLGGEILKQKNGHPTKGTYWFPEYNSAAGIKALEFLKQQVGSGIRPQINHFWGQEFADKKFAVMLEGSWLLGVFPHEQWATLNQKIGMLPMFPVPKIGDKSATMIGGWILGIPETSQNKDLAWELLTTLVDPQVLTPMLQKEGYLPTQKPIGEGHYAAILNASIPYYREMISMIPIGHSRPNIPEYPQISDNIKQAIDEVYYGMKDPKQALDEAAAKSAKVLGW
ncbi:MAG: extracellular solute-binding protein [Nitrososphaeraceae archaeon]|jgi:multiple sugar transport system substrate-binding protein